MKENNFANDDKLKEIWDSISPDVRTDEALADAVLKSTLAEIEGRRQKPANGRRKAILSAAIAAAIAIPLLSAWGALSYVRRHSQKEVRMLECFVPYGSVKNLQLSDGSEITLNAGSTFIYPDTFQSGERKVFLSGEAAFKVAKDAAKPFIVGTSDFDVKVLGTVFNVSSYPEAGESSVSLSEGSVQLTRGAEAILLSVNQMASYDRGSDKLSVAAVDAAETMLWKQGGFAFERASIGQIMSDIHKIYGFDAVCTNMAKYSSARITWKNDNRISLETFLEILKSLIPGMQYGISEDTIYFK